MIFSLNTNEWDINKEGVTMFEKEAKEYAHRKCGTIQDTEWKFCELDWHEGAEFGYRKANEWHFVLGMCKDCTENYIVHLRDENKRLREDSKRFQKAIIAANRCEQILKSVL